MRSNAARPLAEPSACVRPADEPARASSGRPEDTVAALRGALARLAHEIRNPLNAIRNAATVLAEGTAEAQEIQEFAGIIRSEAQRLETSLTQLLDYARPTRLRLEWASAATLLQSLCEVYSRSFSALGIGFEMDFDRSAPPLRLDAAAMSRVISNLLVNAQQAMAGGGRIRVSSRLAVFTAEMLASLPGHRRTGDPKDLRYIQTPDGARELRVGAPAVIIEVADTGPGVPIEAIGRMFEPFFTTKPEGTGLGLAMVRELIQAHGGLVTVRTSPQGTCFSLALPVPNPEDGENA